MKKVFKRRTYPAGRECLLCFDELPIDRGGSFCGNCGFKWDVQIFPKVSGQSVAIAAVNKAIREGRLAAITKDTQCIDCGKPARVYDHRDYNFPLDVDPVCQGCNIKRGSAIWAGRQIRFDGRYTGYLYHVFTSVLRGPQNKAAA